MKIPWVPYQTGHALAQEKRWSLMILQMNNWATTYYPNKKTLAVYIYIYIPISDYLERQIFLGTQI